MRSATEISFSKGGLIAKRPTDMLDGYPFFLGISCLLRQYPTTIMDTVIEYVAQYIRSFVKEQARYELFDNNLFNNQIYLKFRYQL